MPWLLCLKPRRCPLFFRRPNVIWTYHYKIKEHWTLLLTSVKASRTARFVYKNCFLFSAGMITSGLFWGFFADTLGRRKLLILGYYLDALIVLCSGLSQSFEMLLTFKYFGGFMWEVNFFSQSFANALNCSINGPFAVLTSYLSEFHSAKYRAKVQLLMGLVLGVASIILPVLAWGMFQLPINLNFLNISI